MPATVIYGDRPPSTTNAAPEGDNLWLSLDELRTATGWELKPQGACLADVCVPIPAGREAEFLRAGGKQFNLAALARAQGQPVVHDDAHSVWVFGETAAVRNNALRSLQAPDFTLPDLDGRLHSLSDYRGKKVLLVSWASW
jgi:AhpC/TSA family